MSIFPRVVVYALCLFPVYAPAFDFSELSIDKAKLALQQKQISCVQLTEYYLQRISTIDQSTGLNAIIYVNPHAPQRARQLDAEFKETGILKPLHCMAVIAKDNYETAGMPTEAGARALKNYIPKDDAFIIKQLLQAGAIIVAKSNMGEFAFSPYETISSTHGETRNAYDLERVPAGSSGGTASAIAADFGIIGLGTDTGNSVRGPSSHLALVGLRPTIGQLSRQGIVPLLYNRDMAGPMTRSVADAALVMEVISAPDAADSAMSQAPKLDWSGFLGKSNSLKSRRIGVLRQLFPWEQTHAEISDLMEAAIADLQKAGALIVDPVEIEQFEQLTSATGFCSRFKYDLNHFLATRDAPVKSFEQIYDEKRYDERSHGAMQWAKKGSDPHSQQPPCLDVERDPRRRALRDAVVRLMRDKKLDALIYPSWSYPPRKLGDLKSPHGNNSPTLAPHSGLPAITLPMGFTKAGLPAGLQLLGLAHQDNTLMEIAYVYEQRTKHRQPPRFLHSKK